LAGVDGGAAAVTKRSDLPVRVASAVVMLALAGGAFWLGGAVLAGFIAAVGLGIFAEWTMLVLAFERRLFARGLWLLAGLGYIGSACETAISLAGNHGGLILLVPVVSVIVIDVGAYFAGRTFGGPKIAPAISPSKTWSGLGGAVIAVTTLYVALAVGNHVRLDGALASLLALGTVAAIIAQSGDFFESWMKRRAGVKDSGRLIPGHGGLFDRADGLIAVLFAIGICRLIVSIV